MAERLIFPDLDSLAQAAAEIVVTSAQAAIAARERFSIGLSGGSTPRPLYALLASPAYAPRIDWPNVHVFWGDERCVPPDHPDSNYRMARETLLDRVPLLPDNIHRMPGERDPEAGAGAYDAHLRSFFAADGEDVPRFDLLLLGMGGDAHTASLFPHSPGLSAALDPLVSTPAFALTPEPLPPEAPHPRITLGLARLKRSHARLLAISGESKRAVWRQVLDAEPASERPIGLFLHDPGTPTTVYWSP